MREFLTTIAQSDFKAKSLFRGILPVSPCGSGFCHTPPYPRARKLFGMRILDERIEKNIDMYYGVQWRIRAGRADGFMKSEILENSREGRGEELRGDAAAGDLWLGSPCEAVRSGTGVDQLSYGPI